MTNRELKNIIQRIIEGEGADLTEIAQKAKVNRSYLSSLINEVAEKSMSAGFVGRIKKAYPAYFTQQKTTISKQTESEPDPNILANLKELRGFAISMLAAQEAQHKTMLESLERIEGKKPGELSAYADTLTVMMLQRLHIAQVGIHQRSDSKVES